MALQTKKIYYIFQLFPLSRALVILAIYYLIRNLIYSVLLFAIIQYLYYKVIYYCIGYIPLVNIDKIFINYKETEENFDFTKEFDMMIVRKAFFENQKD